MHAVCSQDGWLELDAYYTGANRGRDPSDTAAPSAKPDGVVLSDSAVDLTQPQANPCALKKSPADDGHGHIIRYSELCAHRQSGDRCGIGRYVITEYESRTIF